MICNLCPRRCGVERTPDKAAGAGFPDSLTGALDGEEKYEVRFFLLDALGELEKFLYAG